MIEPTSRLRLPPQVASASIRKQLGALLLENGLIDADQLERALAEKATSGHRLGEILTAHGWVPPSGLARALAEQHELEFLDLTRSTVDPAAVALLPEAYARQYDALPVRFLSDDVVLVAVADPSNVTSNDNLDLALGREVRFAVASAPALANAIARAYGDDGGGESHESDRRDAGDAANTTASGPAIALVDRLLFEAIAEGASDLHFEPQAGELVVRARIDGVMRRVEAIPLDMQPVVTTRLKVMAGLDIAERRAPQDGRISVSHAGKNVDLRVAVLPTTHGEQIVLRIMNREGGRLELGELGMTPMIQETFLRAIHQPFGAVLTVGPSGSGKTTTLYAALEILNESERSLMTIEDPVEYQMSGINQVEVRARSGLTFARGLRTILRSDPDVLLVGEIRDEETAQIAIQAAMTGHIVLSTLHTHDAAASIARLADMGVDPGLLATAVNCIVAQRLARRLCVHCREEYRPSDAELAELGLDAREDVRLFHAIGCPDCGHTGYSGRVALYEVMALTGRLRRLIKSGSSEEIAEAAVAAGMTTLRQDGIRLVLAGISSLDEIRRVTGDWAGSESSDERLLEPAALSPGLGLRPVTAA